MYNACDRQDSLKEGSLIVLNKVYNGKLDVGCSGTAFYSEANPTHHGSAIDVSPNNLLFVMTWEDFQTTAENYEAYPNPDDNFLLRIATAYKIMKEQAQDKREHGPRRSKRHNPDLYL